MTAAALEPAPRVALPLGRVLAVARVLLTNAPVAIGFPLAIMGSSFVINWMIFAGGVGEAVENPTTGGLASLYIVQLAVCAQGLHQTFSFAVGLGATRRTFYAAAVLVASGQSLLFGLFLYGCGAVERATDGWGVNLRFFDPLPLTHSGSPLTILVYTVPLLLMSAVGLFMGTVSKRWGANGIFFLSILVILVAGGVAALIGYLDGWRAVFTWLADQSWLSVTIGWSLVPMVLAGAAGWLVLRRAVP